MKRAFCILSLIVAFVLVLAACVTQLQGGPAIQMPGTLVVGVTAAGVQVTLPVTAEVTQTLAPSPTPEPRRVLILDDSSGYVGSATPLILRALPGWQVVHTLTCEQAKAAATSQKFDLMVVDMQLANGEIGIDCIPALQSLQPGAMVVIWSTEIGFAERYANASGLSGIKFMSKGQTGKQLIDFFVGLGL